MTLRFTANFQTRSRELSGRTRNFEFGKEWFMVGMFLVSFLGTLCAELVRDGIYAIKRKVLR